MTNKGEMMILAILLVTAPVWILYVGAYVIENGLGGAVVVFFIFIALFSTAAIPWNGWMER